MSFSKRGEEGSVYTVVLWVVLVVVIVSMILASQFGIPGFNLDNLPGAVEGTINVITTIVTPIVEGIYDIVAPRGEPENVKMIAFSIFLLLTLIGTRSLAPFLRGTFVAFFVSLIIGIIAARSLTATVLAESALGASPIAAVSLLLGFIPVFALTKNIDSWGLTQYSKMAVFTVAGVVYWLIFWFAFNSSALGLTYGLGIILLGAGQIIAPHFRKTKKQRKSRGLGRYMAEVHDTIETAKGMKAGSEARGFVPH